MEISKSTEAQAWYMDFAVALFLFIFTLGIYFSHTSNVQTMHSGDLSGLTKDAQLISSSLLLSGYPPDWDENSVINIGIADSYKVNTSKIDRFKRIDYKDSKKKFATGYDYFVFFVNDNEEVLNVGGICGIGHPQVQTSFNTSSAYYYSDSNKAFLKDFMVQSLGADVYFDAEISGLASNLKDYHFVVLENPSLSASDYNNYRDELENFAKDGGIIIATDEFGDISGNVIFGAEFYRKAGQTSVDRNSTVNSSYLSPFFLPGGNILFSDANYVQNSLAADFNIISSFNDGNMPAISAWSFGNGSIYFFSSSNAASTDINFTDSLQKSILMEIEGTCSPVDLSAVSKKDLVKTERYLSYNSRLVKLKVFVWK